MSTLQKPNSLRRDADGDDLRWSLPTLVSSHFYKDGSQPWQRKPSNEISIRHSCVPLEFTNVITWSHKNSAGFELLKIKADASLGWRPFLCHAEPGCLHYQLPPGIFGLQVAISLWQWWWIARQSSALSRPQRAQMLPQKASIFHLGSLHWLFKWDKTTWTFSVVGKALIVYLHEFVGF